MRLTAERDPETIKRYGHIKPARGWGVHVCSARCPGTTRTCTLEAGHRGPHVAHGAFRKVVAVWDDGGMEAHPSVQRLRSSLEGRAASGVRKDDRESSVAFWRQMVPSHFSVEEAALLALLLVVLGLAFYWLMLLFRASAHLV